MRKLGLFLSSLFLLLAGLGTCYGIWFLNQEPGTASLWFLGPLLTEQANEMQALLLPLNLSQFGLWVAALVMFTCSLCAYLIWHAKRNDKRHERLSKDLEGGFFHLSPSVNQN